MNQRNRNTAPPPIKPGDEQGFSPHYPTGQDSKDPNIPGPPHGEEPTMPGHKPNKKSPGTKPGGGRPKEIV